MIGIAFTVLLVTDVLPLKNAAHYDDYGGDHGTHIHQAHEERVYNTSMGCKFEFGDEEFEDCGALATRARSARRFQSCGALRARRRASLPGAR